MLVPMRTRSDLEAWRLAGRQAGYLTLRQALACGVTKATIRANLRSGLWTSVKPGVYLVAGHRQTVRGRIAAACAALGAVASHESAAELHGIPHVRRGMAVVTVPIRTTNRFPQVVVHQSTDLTARYVTEIDRIPVTTPVRTVIDLAVSIPRRRLGRIIDRCVVAGLFSVDHLAETVGALSRQGKKGFANLHALLEERTSGFVPTESELEDDVLERLRAWGLPEPVKQYPLPWRSPKRGRVDFAYPKAKLIVEVDGRAWHLAVDAFDEDRMRDNHAQLAGWRVIRVTHRMLEHRPGEVRRLLWELLGPAARSS